MRYSQFLSALLLLLLLGASGSALDDPAPPSITVPTIDDGHVLTWRPLTWGDFNGQIGRFRREAAGIVSQWEIFGAALSG